jgi:transcriptional regulator with XRE-family HTH domain
MKKKDSSSFSLGNRLELFRKKNSKTQKEMATAGGITEQAMSGYNKGTIPSAEVLAAWARAFDLNINWLLLDEGEMLREPSSQLEQNLVLNHKIMELLYENRDLRIELEKLRAERVNFPTAHTGLGTVPTASPDNENDRTV